MKITRKNLKRLIREELSRVLEGDVLQWNPHGIKSPVEAQPRYPDVIGGMSSVTPQEGELVDFSVARFGRDGDGSGSLVGGPPGMRHVVRDYEYEREFNYPANATVGDVQLNPNPPLGHPDHISRYPESYDDPAKSIVRAARALKEMGIPLSTKVGIVENEGGHLMAEERLMIGTLKDALSGVTPESVRWQSPDEVHDFEILYFDVSAGGIDGVLEEVVPFISLGSVIV